MDDGGRREPRAAVAAELLAEALGRPAAANGLAVADREDVEAAEALDVDRAAPAFVAVGPPDGAAVPLLLNPVDLDLP